MTEKQVDEGLKKILKDFAKDYPNYFPERNTELMKEAITRLKSLFNKEGRKKARECIDSLYLHNNDFWNILTKRINQKFK